MRLKYGPRCSLLLAGALLLSLIGWSNSARVSAAPDLAKQTCKTGAKPSKKACLTLHPHPMAIHPSLEADRAVTQTITMDGGTLTTTAHDGTTFTLTVPSGAVEDPLAITMTPVSSISGVPHLQTVYGVQLEPEGTHFFQPLTLVMHPPHAVPLKRQLAFSAQGDGGNFHLYPSAATSSDITLQLNHFSIDLTGWLKTGSSQVGPNTVTTWVGIPGMVKGTVQHAPVSWEAEAEELRGAIEATRRAQENGEASPYTTQQLEQMEDTVLRDAYTQTVDPALKHALDDSNASDSEMQEGQLDGLAFAGQIEKMMDSRSFPQDILDKLYDVKDRVLKVAEKRLKKAEAACGTTTRILGYDPTYGWLIDAQGAHKILEMLHSAHPMGMTEDINAALQPCRPRGFKFGPGTLAWDGVFNHAQTPPCTSNCNDGCDPRYCHGYTVSEHEEWTVAGRTCGDDPHGQWQITTHNAGQGRAQDGYVFSTVGADRANGTEYWTLADDNVFRYVGGAITDVPVVSKSGSFQVGPPPQVTIHITTTSGGNPAWSPIDQTKTVPVTEDTSCPDNPTSPKTQKGSMR